MGGGGGGAACGTRWTSLKDEQPNGQAPAGSGRVPGVPLRGAVAAPRTREKPERPGSEGPCGQHCEWPGRAQRGRPEGPGAHRGGGRPGTAAWAPATRRAGGGGGGAGMRAASSRGRAGVSDAPSPGPPLRLSGSAGAGAPGPPGEGGAWHRGPRGPRTQERGSPGGGRGSVAAPAPPTPRPRPSPLTHGRADPRAPGQRHPRSPVQAGAGQHLAPGERRRLRAGLGAGPAARGPWVKARRAGMQGRPGARAPPPGGGGAGWGCASVPQRRANAAAPRARGEAVGGGEVHLRLGDASGKWTPLGGPFAVWAYLLPALPARRLSWGAGVSFGSVRTHSSPSFRRLCSAPRLVASVEILYRDLLSKASDVAWNSEAARVSRPLTPGPHSLPRALANGMLKL